MLCYSCRLSQSTVVHSFKPMSREEESGFVNHPYKGMKLPRKIFGKPYSLFNRWVLIFLNLTYALSGRGGFTLHTQGVAIGL